jgi:hypothetical protein
MRKWFLPLVTVGLAISTATFWQLWRQERAHSDALHAASGTTRQDAQVPLTVPPAAGPLPPAGIRTPSDSGVAEDRQDSSASDEMLLLQDPAYRAAYRKYRLAELTHGHVDITRVLGISAEIADRLLAYLVDREVEYSLSGPWRNAQTEEEQNARTLDNERRKREEDAGIGSIIGDGRVTAWHDYQDSLRQRHEVLAVGRSLALSGAPLRDDQVDALVAVMAAEQRRTEDDISQFGAGLGPRDGREVKVQGYLDARQSELDRAREDRVRAEAARILTPDQLTAFVDLRRQWQAGTDAEIEYYRAADEARRRVRENR